MVTIRRVNPIPVDVLIFENLGTPFLVKAIPEEMNYVILNIRDELPIVLTRRFIFSWIRLLLNTTLGIRQSYIIALMAEFGARIVLSFADNSPILGNYQKLHPEVLVLSVQNALRYPYEIRNIQVAPSYYCLGTATRNHFSIERVPYQRLVVSGSLPLGIYLAENRRDAIQNTFDLVFVSSYRASFETPPSLEPDKAALSIAHKKIFLHLLQYAEENKVELYVVTKGKVKHEGEHFAEEKRYFEALANGRRIRLSSTVKDTFKSYQYALRARVLVTVDSTLGYEALSVGRRVLFGWGANPKLARQGESLTKNMPDHILLTNDKAIANSKEVFFDDLLTNKELDYVTAASLLEKNKEQYQLPIEFITNGTFL